MTEKTERFLQARADKCNKIKWGVACLPCGYPECESCWSDRYTKEIVPCNIYKEGSCLTCGKGVAGHTLEKYPPNPTPDGYCTGHHLSTLPCSASDEEIQAHIKSLSYYDEVVDKGIHPGVGDVL